MTSLPTTAVPAPTGCTCTGPGFCPRWGRDVTERAWRNCQAHPRHIAAIEALNAQAAAKRKDQPPPANARLDLFKQLGRCDHLGAVIPGQPCGSTLYPCGLHGGVTTTFRPCKEAARCCVDCPDHTGRAKVRRHLLWHIWPVAGNGTWQRNARMLRDRLPLFTGRRVVAVVTDARTDSPGDVLRELGGDVEILTFRNNPRLREVVTFTALWEKVSNDLAGVTFYGHAKGVTRPVNDGVTVHPWTDIMYETLLDYWPVVADVLTRHPVAGTFKKVGRMFRGSLSTWHYSGSFWWARNAAVFGLRDWRRIDRHWWGNEAWPGLHWKPQEAGTVFHEGGAELNLYDMGYLQGTVLPALERWRAANAERKTTWLATVSP